MKATEPKAPRCVIPQEDRTAGVSGDQGGRSVKGDRAAASGSCLGRWTVVDPGYGATTQLCASVKVHRTETSLVAQWLRLSTPNAGDPHSIPGQGIGFHVLQAGWKIEDPIRHS